MNTRILAAVILFSLAAPVPVLAETPPATDKPLTVEVEAIDAESSGQQVMLDRPADTAAPAADVAEVQVAAEVPTEELADGASASGTAAPKQPCPMHGMGMMRKGMGMGGKGQGRKPGCDRDGREQGQQNSQEQVLRRLDMIEARIAKIEVMLERLMQR